MTDASAAIAAYEHAARLARNRSSISQRIDGDHAGAVSRALDALAEQYSASAAALKSRNAFHIALTGADHE